MGTVPGAARRRAAPGQRPVTRGVRVLLAVALVLLSSGCLRFRADLTIAGDATVTGTVIAAARLSDSPPVDVTDPGGGGGSGPIRTEPYTEDGYVGTRVIITDATFVQVERFFADQGGALVPSLPGSGGGSGQSALVARLSLRKDGGDVVVAGRFLFPDFAVQADPGGDFEARLAITFPGDVAEASGRIDGRTVTWTFAQGRAQDVTARAGLGTTTPTGWLLRAAIAALAVGLLVALVALFRHRARRKELDEPAPPPWPEGGAPVPPGPGLSRPGTYEGS